MKTADFSIATSQSTARVEWVDIAKCICIILVVMMHTTLGLEAASGQKGWMHAVVEFAKPFRMPDFFMVSGLFLAATINRPWRLYLDRKVVHFFYFYILWVGIQFALKAPSMMSDGQSLGMIGRSFLFTLVQPFGTLWFIYILPLFFVVTKLFKNTPWLLFGAALVLQILPINTTSFLPVLLETFSVSSVDSHWVLVDEFCSFFVYFLGGYLFAPHIFKLAEWARENVVKSLGLLATWFIVNLAAVTIGFDSLPLIGLALGGLGALAIIVAASLLAHAFEKAAIFNPLSYIGANSIVIYLAFFVPMIATRILFLKIMPWLDPGTMALASIVVGVVTPLIGYKIIEKIGFGRFLFHRPDWAFIADRPKITKVSLQPAE